MRKPKNAVPPRPEWATTTPDQQEKYEIGMWVDTDPQQAIRLSRGEYIALKSQLAKLRGYAVEEAAQHGS